MQVISLFWGIGVTLRARPALDDPDATPLVALSCGETRPGRLDALLFLRHRVLLPPLPACCSLTSQMLCISGYFTFSLSNANPDGAAGDKKEKEKIINAVLVSLPLLSKV